MTKKAVAKAKKAAWSQALVEGRVVKINNGETFRSYPSAEQAALAVKNYIAFGMVAEIIKIQKGETK